MTIGELQRKKGAGEKITMLTAYDYGMASFLDQSGIDMILVGIPWAWWSWATIPRCR